MHNQYCDLLSDLLLFYLSEGYISGGNFVGSIEKAWAALHFQVCYLRKVLSCCWWMPSKKFRRVL